MIKRKERKTNLLAMLMTICCREIIAFRLWDNKKRDQYQFRNVHNTDRSRLHLMLSTCDWLTQVAFSGTVWRGPVCLYCFLEARRWSHDHKLPSISNSLTTQTPQRLAWGNTRHYKTWGCQVRRLYPSFMAPVQPWLRPFLVPITLLLLRCRVARFGAVHSPFMAQIDTWLRPFVIYVCILIVARSVLRLTIYTAPHPQFVTHHWAPPFVFLSCQLQP